MKKSMLVVAVALFIILPVVSADVWWDSDWHYRVGLDVGGNGLVRSDWPVEFFVDFGAELSSAGSVGGFDVNSVRVVEYDDSGNVMYEVSSGFEASGGFDSGNVVFILSGTTGASEIRHFWIYFDDDLYSKSLTNYPSTLSYSFDGSEFDLGNSFLDLKIDTSGAEGSSGIYYANRIDSGTLISNLGSSVLPMEYVQYRDGTQNYGFDLDGSASLEFDSSVKKVVKQSGQEVLWNTGTVTNSTIEKYYTIYEGSPWVKIRQAYSNNGVGDVTRRSNGISALALDTQRAFGMDNLIGPSLDPYSWKSTTKISPSLGVGVVNLDEVGTSNYFAQGSIPAGKIGIQLNPTVIGGGSTIENEALVYFNDENDHNPLQELNYQFTTPVSETKSLSEKYSISVDTITDFKNYNLNEIVLVTANITTDSHDLASTVNATLDMGTVGTGDDLTIVLYDDGLHLDGAAGDKVFSNNFILNDTSFVGTWKVVGNLYDVQNKLVASHESQFEIRNEFNSKLFIHNPTGLAGRVINSTFQLKNYRNDTVTPNANVVCLYNGTQITNITDLFNGNYSLSFISPGVLGTYELLCTGEKNNNLDSDSELFYLEPAKTDMGIILSINETNITTITQSSSDNFSFSTFLNNYGIGRASFVNVSLVSTAEILFNTSFETCNTLETLENCNKSFLVTVKNKTIPGDYNVSVNLSWNNLDKSINSTNKRFIIHVLENPQFTIDTLEFNKTIEHGENLSVGTIGINSVGNYPIKNINFNCLEGEVCRNFTILFLPSSLNNLTEGLNYNFDVFVEVPLGYDFGNYSGVFEVMSSNSGSENFTVNIVVPMNDSWTVSRNNCSMTVLIDSTGDVCVYTFENTGNLKLNYTINPAAYNYVVFLENNFSLDKQTNHDFYVRYNTTNSSQGTFQSSYTFTGDSIKGSRVENFDIFFDVVFGPSMTPIVDLETEQGSDIEIRTSIVDRSGATISFVKANITLPNGTIDTVNLVNLDTNLAFGVSTWGVNFTDTVKRGVYEVLIYSEDLAGGVGNTVGYGRVYAKLNVTLETGWEDYLLGETGSIYYQVKDLDSNYLESDVNITMYDPSLRVRLYEEHKTNQKGVLKVIPSFSIPDDSETGRYNLTSESVYFDSIGNKTVSQFYIDNFNVYNPLSVKLNTNVVWYPNGVMTFYILASSNGKMGSLPTAVDLVVYDPAQAIYFTANITDMKIIQQTNESVLYYYKYAMPPTTPVGNYLASVSVLEGKRSFYDVESFFVSAGGPFDLVLTINDTEVEREGEVKFDILMKNMGEVSQDVLLDFWISDAAGNNYSKVTGEAIYVPAHGNTTISRKLYIYPNQPLELHTMTVKMDYSTILDPIVTTGTFSVVEKKDNKTNPVIPKESSGGGGGGGGSGITGETIVKTLDPIVIVDIDPNELESSRGDTGYIMIKVKSNLDYDVNEVFVNFSLEGYNNLTELKGEYSFAPRETVLLPLKIYIPDDFPSGFYTGELLLTLGNESVKKKYNVNVFDSKDELISYRIISLKSDFDSLKGAVSQAKSDGLNVASIELKILSISNDLDLVEENFNNRKYFETLELLSKIENDIEETRYELDTLEPGVKFIDAGYFLVILGILIIIVLVIILRRMMKRLKNKLEYKKLKTKYIKKRPKKYKFRLKKLKLPKRRSKVVKKRVKKEKEDINKRKSKHEILSKTEARDYLKTLEEQFRFGYISKDAYDKMKESFEEDLKKAK